MKNTLMLSALLLAACATTSGVIPMGDDTYMIARTEKAFDSSGSKVKAAAINEANQFCASKGKKFLFIKATQNDMVPFRSDAQAELEFKCN